MDKKYWIAIVVCQNKETGRVLSSFLTFWARNKFYALQAVKTMLPENPEYLDSTGQLRPFHLIELKSIKEHQVDYYQAAFYESFQHAFCSEMNPSSAAQA